MKKKYGFILFFVCVASCGSSPSIIERLIDVDEDAKGMLIAPKKEDDLPLSYCAKSKCYVYNEEDVKKIKKYIATLEARLRRCDANARTK